MMNEDGADDDDQKMMNPMKMTKTTLEAVYSTDQGKHQPVSKIKSNPKKGQSSRAYIRHRLASSSSRSELVVVGRSGEQYQQNCIAISGSIPPS